MIYFQFNIYKWTLTLPMVKSSSAVFAIYFMWSAGPDRKGGFLGYCGFFSLTSPPPPPPKKRPAMPAPTKVDFLKRNKTKSSAY